MERAVIGCGICILWGTASAYQLAHNAKVLLQWLYALEAMRVHSTCARETPKQVFLAGAGHAAVLEKIAKTENLQEIEQLLKTENLPPDAQTIVFAALKAVWDGALEEQEEKLRFAVSQVSLLWRTAQEKCSSSVRLYMTLGILSGLCTGLVLL